MGGKKQKAFNMWSTIILGLSTLNVLIASSHAVTTNPRDLGNNCREKCFTDTCADEALRLIKRMDDKVDPCENFYEFACGTYLKETSLQDTNVASITADLQGAITVAVFTDLRNDIADTDLDAFKKIKTFYQNCIDEEKIEKAGTQPLLQILNSIGGWPVVLGNRWDERRFDLMRVVYTIKEQKLPAFFPSIFTIELDNLDSSKYTLYVNNPKMNVNAGWFTGNDPNRIKNLFTDMLLKVATTLGARNDTATLRDLQQVVNFEIKLFRISTPEEKLTTLSVERRRTSIRELSRKYPNIPWLEYINRNLRPSKVSMNEEEYVYVNDPDFIGKLVDLLQRTPKRVLANFLAWRTVQASLPYMPKELNSAADDYESALEGAPSSATDRNTLCFNKAQENFKLGLSAMYIKNHFDKESIQKPVAEMIENLKGQARKALQENNWMDDTTKRRAVEKLDAMASTIGYDDELKDDAKVNEYYRELEINPGSFFETALNTSYFTDRASKKSLKKPTSGDAWSMKPGVIDLNAYNFLQLNSIEIPAAFFSGFYKMGKPQFVNYGIAGAFIGHEIFHGFDNQGKQYNKWGNQVNWWTPESEQKFRQKAQCIIDQYSNFTVPGADMNINGELSQGENIADNGGFKIGYRAYREWMKKHNIVEGCLPSLNYTPQQMFWISSAAVWCSKEQPEYTRSSLATDVHSPAIARVMLTFSNIKEFSDDFKCKPGSRMNPHNRCQVF